jgi:heme exporter protein CcmB
MRACCGAAAAMRCSRRLFALLVVVLFALALGGEARALERVAAPVLWLAVLLAGLLALDTLFRGDAEDGRSNNGCSPRCRCRGWCWCARSCTGRPPRCPC